MNAKSQNSKTNQPNKKETFPLILPLYTPNSIPIDL